MADNTLLPNVSRSALWRRAVFWLLLLGPLFFITYGQVNLYTATRQGVGSLAFGWETHIPFLPWTIVPYWSIDLLYGISLFVCTSVREQTRHAYRLIMASLLACAGFLLFPLKFSFVRPSSDGVFGWLFQQLEMFDLPYNQAPSLHIILAWLLWLRFWPHMKGYWRGAMSAWFLLIAASVLTTWQHHIIDVITGVVTGIVVSYIVPMQSTWRWHKTKADSLGLALRYGIGALLCLVLGLMFIPLLWLLWPAAALALVALGYAGLGETIFQKDTMGKRSISATLLLWPYLFGAKISMHGFVRKLPPVAEIGQGIFIGSYPLAPVNQQAVLDLTGELSRNCHTQCCEYVCYPLMDLCVPDIQKLSSAVMHLKALHQQRGNVLVHCALGLSRSALVVAAWLLEQGIVATPERAAQWLRERRPQIVLHLAHLQVLQLWWEQQLQQRMNQDA